jgi:hypothetical protein
MHKEREPAKEIRDAPAACFWPNSRLKDRARELDRRNPQFAFDTAHLPANIKASE